MKKITKPLIVFILGIIFGYYISYTGYIKNIFTSTYKAFQIGVYTNKEAADTFSKKYNNSIVIEDNELYRVYVSILKNEKNIQNMEKYLNNQGISYYLKDIEINNNTLKKEINEYESLMNNENEVVFLEINKMIIEKYKETI